MWLHPDPNQALSFAVRLCAIGQLVGLLELVLVRGELSDSGFLDWSMIGNLSPRARTGPGSVIRRAFRRLPRRASTRRNPRRSRPREESSILAARDSP